MNKTPNDTPKLRMNMWFESEQGVVFGLGRMLLLEKIQEKGSLRAAAACLSMSYRAAWGKLKATEQALGCALVEKSPCNHSRYQLTSYGLDLLSQYELLFNDVEAYAFERGKKLLPFQFKTFA